jgi:flagellin-like hook-associated protein FlgL
MLSGDASDGVIGVFLGNGNGTFKAHVSYFGSPQQLSAVDMNGDGKLDLVSSSRWTDTIDILLGNGDGSYKAGVTFGGGTGIWGAMVLDMNGDGTLDVVSSARVENTVSIFLGNGDGTLKARTTYATGGDTRMGDAGDLNGDGVADIIAPSSTDGNIDVFLSNTTSSTTALSFLTQSSALSAMTALVGVQASIEGELANIGAFQSRVNTAVANLQQTRENYDSAASGIMDADVAEESANLVKQQILQQASAAVLAQANQEPGLLLRLVQGAI